MPWDAYTLPSLPRRTYPSHPAPLEQLFDPAQLAQGTTAGPIAVRENSNLQCAHWLKQSLFLSLSLQLPIQADASGMILNAV
jgi:hypothetical protein